jgi:hypothetical protein
MPSPRPGKAAKLGWGARVSQRALTRKTPVAFDPAGGGCIVCQACDADVRAAVPAAPARITGVHRHVTGPWVQLMCESAYPSSIDDWKGTAGKYLFFSARPELLVALAQREISQHGFRTAKVKIAELIGPDHVLYLYWHDGRRADELAARWTPEVEPEIKCRGWKLEAASLRGQYSEQFRSQRDEARRRAGLSPQDRA